ncbi:DUF6461 domain-containing protein [Streptomyces sp. NPDC059564]|uniref:DUF6461 domain-containing protein n=1 Tax=Streptomyces sp. NPDC059564 TaxID=3346865 RepID=UPI0036C1B983
MNTATAADYGWIRSASSAFAYALECGYTMTLVGGVAPEDAFTMAGAAPGGVCRGLDALIERHVALLDESDAWPESFLTGAFTVATATRYWTVVLEFGGALGMRSGFLGPLSNGTRVVSHSSNGGKPMDFFHWYENGELRTTFEWPADRTGRTPDDLNGLMREVGLDPSGDEDPAIDHKAAVLALTERLTGVRLTEELLRDTTYLTAAVPEEPAAGRTL